MDATKTELSAIRALQRLARKWPDTLWLYSASGSLHVMRCDDNSRKVHSPDGGIDPDYIVGTISGIQNDGGDW